MSKKHLSENSDIEETISDAMRFTFGKILPYHVLAISKIIIDKYFETKGSRSYKYLFKNGESSHILNNIFRYCNDLVHEYVSEDGLYPDKLQKLKDNSIDYEIMKQKIEKIEIDIDRIEKPEIKE